MRIGGLFLLAVLAVAGCASSQPGIYSQAAVASDHEIASRAGAEILRAGGNAVDAAVATSFTLSVVRPFSCGIGGGGFMVIHLAGDAARGIPGRSVALNYRETAPGAVGPDFFASHPDPLASTVGASAAGVPGTVAGLLYALERFGTLDRATVLAPAIRAAEEGFVVDAAFVEAAEEVLEGFQKRPADMERFRFVWTRYLREGRVKVGDHIRVPEQAVALRLIAARGSEAFYRGPIAEAVIRSVESDSGPMTPADLAGYRVVEVEPLRFRFMGRTFLTMPPPSSGGLALGQVLGILEEAGYAPDAGGQPGPGARHMLVEAMKHAFADRAEWLGDPAFVDVPVGRLLERPYLRERAGLIRPDRTRASDEYGTREGARTVRSVVNDAGTSHFCVIDERGNAVACTETINTEFGSMVSVEPYGFTLNNQLDDFTTHPGRPNTYGLRQSERNAPAPGKRPLSSMTPTIVLDEQGRVEMIAGASGGPRIISATLQVLLAMLVGGKDAQAAVSLGRIHHQWQPDRVLAERDAPHARAEPAGAFAEEMTRELSGFGHSVRPIDSVGVVQAIRRAAHGRGWSAASDPRKGGKAEGY